MERLHQFEMLDIAAVHASGSHPVSLDKLCKDARDRLAAIKQDDLDELMSFRVSGRRRIWCRMQGNVMLVLWWDPEHKVCPSLKKHT